MKKTLTLKMGTALLVVVAILFSQSSIFAQGTCATAVTLTPGTQQCGDTATGGDTFDDNACLGSYDGGDDYLFVVTVPAGEDGNALALDLTSGGSWTGIAISEGCPEGGAGVCFGSATSGSGDESFVSDPLTGGNTYYIHISTYPSPQSVTFCLDAAYEVPPAPPANDDCSGVIDLGGETSPLTANTCAAGNDFILSCLTSSSSQDLVYSIEVPDGATLNIGQTSNSYDSKHRLSYGGACPGDTEVICRDDSDTATETFVNTTGSTQTAYWIQSAYSGCGDFTLAWEIISCVQSTFTLADGGNDCPIAGFYIDVDITNIGSAASVNILNDQGVTATNGVDGTASPYTVGPFSAGTTVTITVEDAADATCTVNDTYTTAIACPPANDDCSGVIDLGGETSPLTANTCAAGNDFILSCLTSSSSQDLVYSIEVPDGATLNIGQTSNSYDSKHRLSYGGACPGDTEVICRDDSDTTTETFVNTTGSTQTAYWIQSAYSGCGDFTLAWEIISCVQSTFTLADGGNDCPTADFYIDVDITDIGSAASVNILNDQGVTATNGVDGTASPYTVGPFSAGTTVTITVEDAADATCTVNDTYTTTSACPPSNDLCADAMAIDAGTSTGGTTVGSTATEEPPFCGTSVGATGVWYTYTSTTAETVTIDICGASHDSKIGVYSGGCGAFTCVVGEDDDCGNDPSVEFETTASFAAETYYIYVNGYSGAQGTFVITVAGVPLPVELISFEGYALEKENKLTWATASEENTEWHIIERSIDGQREWSEIGKVRAAGTTADIQRYELLDNSPVANAYYRVKSLDFDLRFEYSNIVNIQREDAPGDISVYPNPVSQHLNVDFTLSKNEEVTVTITDVTGKLISVESLEANRGLNSHVINFKGLNSGVYFVSMISTSGKVTERIVKN